MFLSSGLSDHWRWVPRLSRAQQQERTRASVLAAARAEFATHGYRDAKIDQIAERADLTRGAVYSNFPSKRALYLAVLVDDVEQASGSPPPSATPSSPTEALVSFARVWLERLPLAGDSRAAGLLQLRSLAGAVDDQAARAALAQAASCEALLLGLALESYRPQRRRHRRMVRLSELVLTLLNGSQHLAESAPGFGDPFDVARACEYLASLDLSDTWDPPHLPFVAPAQAADGEWTGPVEAHDLVSGGPVRLDGDGVTAFLGTRRLQAAEEAVRAARRGDRVTVVVQSADQAEIGRLVQLRIGDIAGCLRRVLPREAMPAIQIVAGAGAPSASAAGLPDDGDATEAAVLLRSGRIAARAAGRGAAYAAAAAGVRRSGRPETVA